MACRDLAFVLSGFVRFREQSVVEEFHPALSESRTERISMICHLSGEQCHGLPCISDYLST
jgi:hypothetical protein